MSEAEKRIKTIEKQADSTEPENRVAEVWALCEIARQLARLGDLYLTDLIFQNRIATSGEDLEAESADYRSPGARAARTFLRRAYHDARSE